MTPLSRNLLLVLAVVVIAVVTQRITDWIHPPAKVYVGVHFLIALPILLVVIWLVRRRR